MTGVGSVRATREITGVAVRPSVSSAASVSSVIQTPASTRARAASVAGDGATFNSARNASAQR